MDFEILDGISRADVAFRVRGRNLSELFSAGAGALLNIMLENPEIISSEKEMVFICQAPDLDLLYHDFLSELIYYKDARKLLLVPYELEIDPSPGVCGLSCRARGEFIDRRRHAFKVDIKAVTLHRLEVRCAHDVWEATAVVDV